MGIFLSCILGARENGKGRENGCWGRYLLVLPQAFFNSIPSPHRSELRDELMWCLPSSSSAILLPNWGREEKVASGDGGVDREKEKEAEEKGPGGGINLRPPSAAHTTQASRGGGGGVVVLGVVVGSAKRRAGGGRRERSLLFYSLSFSFSLGSKCSFRPFWFHFLQFALECLFQQMGKQSLSLI